MTLDVGSIISIIATSLTCIGLGLTVFQLWRKKKIDEAKLVADILKEIRSNPKTSKIEYIFEYRKQHWYSKKFHESVDEPYVDAFLAQMNYILFAKSNRLISAKTLKIFEYDLKRTVEDEDCLCYLWNLYQGSKKEKKECPFSYLISFAKESMGEEKLAQFESDKESGIFRNYSEF